MVGASGKSGAGATASAVRQDEGGSGVARGGFDGDLGHLAGLVAVNTLGTFLTAGLYRFFARTRLRRFFWNHLHLDGRPAEYTGHGSELLIGWAGAVLLLSGLAVGIAFLVVTEEELSAAASPSQLLLPALLLVLYPAALWRARAYRLSRTTWRGVAFAQDGATGLYVLRWVAWVLFVFNPLTVWLTLLFYPLMRADLERFRARHTLYGDRRFALDARGTALLTAWVPVWLSALLLIGALLWLLVVAMTQMNGGAVAWSAGAGGAATAIVSAILLFLAYVRYRVREFRHFVASARLGTVRFESGLDLATVLSAATPYALGMLAYLYLINVLLFDLVLAAGAGRGPLPWLDQDTLLTSLIVLITGVFLVSLSVGLVFNVFLRFFLIGAAARSLTVVGVEALDEVEARRGANPAFGEGLADALGAGRF